MRMATLCLALYLFLTLSAEGLTGNAHFISSCVERFTSGDMYGGEERFIQEKEYKSTCQQTCKELYPDSIGVTESLKQKYSSGENKCWCEFGDPKLDDSNNNYQTCVFGCPIPALAPRQGPVGIFTCSGHGDPYYNIPKTTQDINIQLLAKGGVMENGEMVIKEELAIARTDPARSECHLICPPGFVPSPHTSTSCSAGEWSHDPKNMLCVPSPCGVPKAPDHGKFSCYGNPSICYLTCDPGYATMSNTTITCQNRSWNMDPESIECEVAVALITGGWGRANQCETADIFSSVDQVCSTPCSRVEYHTECSTRVLPPLKMGVAKHTSHLLNGEILVCGGALYDEWGWKDYKVIESCFKMVQNNTWVLHSMLPKVKDGEIYNHFGAIQQGKLQLIAGLFRYDKPILELNGNTWTEGRKPALPPAAFISGITRQCLVVTSPTTFVVIGASINLLNQHNESTVLQFNSLTGDWFELPEIPEGRHDHACALVTTRSGPGIMVAGGKSPGLPGKNYEDLFLKSVYLLDLGTMIWHPAGNLTYAWEIIDLVVLGDKIMLLGNYMYSKYGMDSFGNHRMIAYSFNNEVAEYVVPCTSLRECSPTQQGTWTLTQRITDHRTYGSVLPVPASRFGCTG